MARFERIVVPPHQGDPRSPEIRFTQNEFPWCSWCGHIELPDEAARRQHLDEHRDLDTGPTTLG